MAMTKVDFKYFCKALDDYEQKLMRKELDKRGITDDDLDKFELFEEERAKLKVEFRSKFVFDLGDPVANLTLALLDTYDELQKLKKEVRALKEKD